ncbi:MAG: TetR family transcriptional regulator [Rhodospirillaceae bacterium]|nr:MAG: TetR family transcriptional regulator [Rhodospirillaceae bacterium]
MRALTTPKTQGTRRVRKDPRREITRVALIEKAETMFADAGVEGVSLRQIGVAIGSGNTNVVAYHFGSKEALIEAIFMHRLPALDARRAELLARVKKAGRAHDLAALMHALWQPALEQKNAHGRHSYVAFLASISRANWGWMRGAVDESFPVTKEIVALIAAALPKKAHRFLRERLRISFAIIAAAVRFCDVNYPHNARRTKDVLADTLRMATAAMAAPAE